MTEDRYARLEALDWWDRERVAGACAIVAGAGALGNEIVKNLALFGWGTILVVDHDAIEPSNLTRSVFFTGRDVGGPKSEILAERAHECNPDVTLVGLVGDLRLMLSAGMVRRSDVVFGCLDNLAARVALGQLSGYAGRVLIDGGLSAWEGTVQVYGPDRDGPCFACTLTEDDLRELTLRQSCLAYEKRSRAAGGVPTTPTIASVIAALMVNEALKWIHRGPHGQRVALGRELRVDLANSRFWNNILPTNDDCILHWVPAVPSQDVRPSWTSSWRDIVRECQVETGAAAGVLRLPIRVLQRWQCPSCGASGDEAQAYAADGNPTCRNCGHDVIPSFISQVDGTEEWAHRSPAEMGFPPWSWVELYRDGGYWTFELAGSSEPFDVLKGR